MVYPTNVLHMATECSNVKHSAAFPVALPEWFIKLFTKDEDVILDPFMGSGTTAVAALKLNRHYIGIEKNTAYQKYAKERVKNFKKELENKDKKKLEISVRSR